VVDVENGHVRKKKIEGRRLLPEVEMRESVEQKVAPEKAARIKRELEILERELSHLHEIQWEYAKRMLKFGVASWVFGLSTFFLAAILLDPALLGRIPSLSMLLLIFAAVVPILITAVRIREFSIKINRMECMRSTILAGYRRAILKRIVGLRETTRYGDEK
jgi:hypothetical protein